VKNLFGADRGFKRQSSVNAVVVCAFLLLAGLTQGCGVGGKVNSNPPPPIAPSGLSYGQPVVDATINQTIPSNVPSVRGTVDSYAVMPALPAGLTLSVSSGIISGTPTVISPKTSYTVTAANSVGSATTTVQITVSLPVPPTDLSYSQPAIDAATNQAISSDVPSISGTVTSYAVTPALPTGLSLSTSNGIISGTPTSLAPLESYTVTASNAGGSASAAILISVTAPLPPPITLAYPQTTIDTYVGQEITPDIPGTAGTITRYSITPALPAGLRLDLSTGVISGTPTAASAQTNYVVTGYNSGGSVAVAVNPTVTVTPTPNTLMQLGNPFLISTLRFASSRILSQDYSGFWILWDYETGTILASGDAGLGGSNVAGFSIPSVSTRVLPQTPAMSGGTIAIGIPGGVQVRSSSDGHVLSTIVSPGFHSDQDGHLSEKDSWQLASDGSYISMAGESGLFVYSPGGELIFSRSGNYGISLNPNLHPSFFAAPGQVQVADGPLGDSNIEMVSVPNGISTLGASYDGQSQLFTGWFTDGSGFFTFTEDGPPTLLAYSNSGVQLRTVPGGLGDDFGGAGQWVWTYQGECGAKCLHIYPTGSATSGMVLTNVDRIFSYGTTLAAASSAFSVIDLSGVTLSKTDYMIPPPINNASSSTLIPFAAASNTEWVVAFAEQGVILDGASLSSGSPRFLGNGSVLSIAGGVGRSAIATGIGQIIYFDPSNTTPEGSISLTSGELELSLDGSVIAASSQDGTLLNIYSLPSGAVSNSVSYSPPESLFSFMLSGSGTMLGQVVSSQGLSSTLQLSPISGKPTTLLGTVTGNGSPILLSPDGTLAAVNDSNRVQGMNVQTATVFLNGQQIAAINGVAVGWIDNGRLLVNSYALTTASAMELTYIGCTIYSPTGAPLASPPLPELDTIQPVTSNTIYAPDRNAIYSLTTGQTTWTNPYSAGSGGAIAGPYVVFESEGRVIAVKY